MPRDDDYDDEDDDEDYRPRKKKKKKKQAHLGMSPTAYWAMRGIVLAVLLAVLGGGLFLLKQRTNENEKIRQQNAEIEARNQKLASE